MAETASRRNQTHDWTRHLDPDVALVSGTKIPRGEFHRFARGFGPHLTVEITETDKRGCACTHRPLLQCADNKHYVK